MAIKIQGNEKIETTLKESFSVGTKEIISLLGKELIKEDTILTISSGKKNITLTPDDEIRIELVQKEIKENNFLSQDNTE